MRLENIIDHTLLRAEATEADIRKLCAEAVEYGFHSVCVNPVWVTACRAFLGNSRVRICAVAGFPLGANSRSVKEMEAEQALIDGADEVDAVVSIGRIKSGEWQYASDELRALRRVTGDKTLKVIAECCYLTGGEKELCARMALDAGADFIKTSTGFGPSGATVKDVALFHQLAGGRMQVKASGGIRDYETAIAMVNAGASRIGTSSGIAIAKGQARG